MITLHATILWISSYSLNILGLVADQDPKEVEAT